LATILGLVAGSVLLPSIRFGLFVRIGDPGQGVRKAILSTSWRVAAEDRRRDRASNSFYE